MSNASATRGRFITLEGIEGTGKSSHVSFVVDWVRARGRDCIATREPGGTELGEALRGILLDPRHQGMDPDAELLLMFAARAEHLRRKILPALDEGRWVVSDRYTDASYAYQSGGRGIPEERVAQLESFVQGSFQPDLTLLFDAPVAVALARIHARGPTDRFENEQSAFFEAVRSAYLDRARQHPQRIRIIDAGQPMETVRAAVAEALEALS